MTPRRRTLLLVLAASFAAPSRLLSQVAKPPPRVAIIFNGTADTDKIFIEPFFQAMRELGYVDGRNVVFDVRYAEGRNDRWPGIVSELLGRKPDVMALGGSVAIRAASKATSTVPIVMMSVANPVSQGLVASLARPGGNVTGNAILTEVVGLKRMELLREVFPKALRFGYLANPANPVYELIRKDLDLAARTVGIDLVRFHATNGGELDVALSAIRDQRIPALLVAEDSLLLVHRKKLVEFLLSNRIPSMLTQSSQVAEGGMMSYGINLPDLSRKSATYVHRILRGAKPADLPVEQPTKFELIVNLKTAKAVGITIPPSVLLRADRVIE